jgi:hypothetical protein
MTLTQWLAAYPGCTVEPNYLGYPPSHPLHQRTAVTVLGPGGGNCGPAWRDMLALTDYQVVGDNGGVCAVLIPRQAYRVTDAPTIKAHGERLLRVFPNATERDPIKLCKRLRKLELEAATIGLRLRNGPEYPGGPDEVDKLTDAVLHKVNALLGNEPADRPHRGREAKNGAVPVFVNRDPRGYALKIDADWLATIPANEMRQRFAGLHRDWGGFGILVPDLTESGAGNGHGRFSQTGRRP